MKVKICGITDIESALVAVEAGADAIGFVFADSKRRVSITDAKKIIASLPSTVDKVGVFVDEKREVILDVIRETGLTMIQLHGNETPEECEGYPTPVIKAIGVAQEEDWHKGLKFQVDYLLLDSPKGKYHGGNGVTFPWDIVNPTILSERDWILAGGLNVMNVKNAIQQLQPAMVDVSSGVETDGKKDQTKINAFIQTVKSYS